MEENKLVYINLDIDKKTIECLNKGMINGQNIVVDDGFTL